MVLFVDRAAVLGAGVMGARIAEVLALNNVNVILKDIDEAALQRGLKTIEGDLDELIRFHAAKAPKAIEDFESRTGVQLTEEQKAKVRETLKPTYDEARKERVLSRPRRRTRRSRRRSSRSSRSTSATTPSSPPTRRRSPSRTSPPPSPPRGEAGSSASTSSTPRRRCR
jgi:hypothetical protein